LFPVQLPARRDAEAHQASGARASQDAPAVAAYL